MPRTALPISTASAAARDQATAAMAVIDLSKLPRGAMFIRILGVNYVRLRTEDDGDLYLTEQGLPFWRQLQPQNWYAPDWFAAKRVRLEGTGTVYRLPTRPLENHRPRSIELVAKWSRVGEDVPLNTFTLQRVISAEFNTPFEEFSLLASLRGDAVTPGRGPRILTQKPLAIYVPPERMQMWQTGRSKEKILSKISRHPSVEVDILRSYIMLYGWIKGVDAVKAVEATSATLPQARMQLQELTLAVDAELRSHGFTVADHKPTHLIVRTENGRLRRRRDGQVLYGLVDYELLAHTPEYEQAIRSRLRYEYFARQRDRFLPRPPSAFPPHLRPAAVLGVQYVYGATESTQGRLWVVGNDPDLFSYFLPERWRQKQVSMSPKNQVYYVQSKDRVHLLWKVSSVGDMLLDGEEEDNPRRESLLRHGFNSPFEEFARALEMKAAGITTVHPRAVYETGVYDNMPGCVMDARRFEAMAQVLSPDGAPVLPPDHDYITLWGYWRGLDDSKACIDAPRWSAIDAAQAVRAEMISPRQLQQVVERQRQRLAEAGFVDENLRGEHVLLSYIPEGSFKTDPDGELALCHCNFEFVRRI
jgi:hypothetical protein